MPKRKAPPTAWKPGQSGNPQGSRGRKIMADALGLALNRKADEAAAKLCEGIDVDPNDIRYIHVIAGQLAKKAAEGDLVAIKEVFDRIDGKAIQENHNIVEAGDALAELLREVDGRSRDIVAPQANGHDTATDEDTVH